MKELKTKYGIHPPQKFTYISKYPQLVEDYLHLIITGTLIAVVIGIAIYYFTTKSNNSKIINETKGQTTEKKVQQLQQQLNHIKEELNKPENLFEKNDFFTNLIGLEEILGKISQLNSQKQEEFIRELENFIKKVEKKLKDKNEPISGTFKLGKEMVNTPLFDIKFKKKDISRQESEKDFYFEKDNSNFELKPLEKAELEISYIGEKEKSPIHFGDFALTLALPISHQTRQNPYQTAQEIVKITALPGLEWDITQQGYINFHLPLDYYQHFFRETFEKKGQNLRKKQKDIRINIEYVSTNPTGYLHLAHFRHAFVGNALANVYQFLGYQIIREYYINDRGGQIISLINSVYHFYHQFQGISQPNPAEIAYAGKSSQEIARKLLEKWGNKYINKELNQEDLAHSRRRRQRPRADHHGFVARLKSACALLGYKPKVLQITLIQMVSLLTRDNQTKRFSKRAGNTIELTEALEYMDKDQLIFFLLEKDPNQPISLNVELLKENKEKTRLYYIQYAHARCHQIFQKAQA
ncbi:2933_t:CDS:2 [Funneliformis geosporum]|uniref:2933_t:CDS:1 n=1 Tax=Funneliformis geosporum TaxID=1117311 RepID=A0A9W4WHF9_9GLOM|nr:2933_t:CDS:2 [Funneliformis geosporum]